MDLYVLDLPGFRKYLPVYGHKFYACFVSRTNAQNLIKLKIELDLDISCYRLTFNVNHATGGTAMLHFL